MRRYHCWLALILAVLLASPLAAQRRSPSVAIGGGVLFADNRDATYLGGRGFSAFLRLGLPRLPFALETSFESIPRSTNILTFPCMAPGCTATFLGPNVALTLAPVLQPTLHAPAASWLFRLGPSVSWLVDREPGSHPLAAGWRAGMSIRAGHRASGFLLSVDYHHLFRQGTAPEWFLPVTIGWEF